MEQGAGSRSLEAQANVLTIAPSFPSLITQFCSGDIRLGPGPFPFSAHVLFIFPMLFPAAGAGV